MEIEVKGHSGRNIEIVKRNNSIYLEKSTYDKKYVKRLYNQATKQKEVSKNEYQYIRVPEIFDIEIMLASRFFIDMVSSFFTSIPNHLRHLSYHINSLFFSW